MNIKPKKKNGIFAFFCAFIPGATEMYYGFLRNGLSLMAVFVLSIMIPVFLRANDAFIFIPMLTWAYSFFHARNYISSTAEDFESATDLLIWDEFTDNKPIKLPSNIVRKWGAILLIIVGIIQLWNNVKNIIYHMIPSEIFERLYPAIDNIPSTVVAIVIIVVGIRLMLGKKEALDGAEN